VTLNFRDQAPVSVPFPAGTLLLTSGGSPGVSFTGGSWTTTQALASGNPAVLATPTFAAATFSSLLPARQVVQSAAFSATFTVLSGPEVQSAQMGFATLLLSTPPGALPGAAIFGNLEIVTSGSGAGASGCKGYRQADRSAALRTVHDPRPVPRGTAAADRIGESPQPPAAALPTPSAPASALASADGDRGDAFPAASAPASSSVLAPAAAPAASFLPASSAPAAALKVPRAVSTAARALAAAARRPLPERPSSASGGYISPSALPAAARPAPTAPAPAGLPGHRPGSAGVPARDVLRRLRRAELADVPGGIHRHHRHQLPVGPGRQQDPGQQAAVHHQVQRRQHGAGEWCIALADRPRSTLA